MDAHATNCQCFRRATKILTPPSTWQDWLSLGAQDQKIDRNAVLYQWKWGTENGATELYFQICMEFCGQHGTLEHYGAIWNPTKIGLQRGSCARFWSIPLVFSLRKLHEAVWNGFTQFKARWLSNRNNSSSKFWQDHHGGATGPDTHPHDFFWYTGFID